MTNADLAELVDTSDEWITERTGIKERRFAPEDRRCPTSRSRRARSAGEGRRRAEDLDLVIVATVTPDMMFPTTSALLADALGADDAAAYDLLAGCTGFMYAIAQAYGMLAGRPRRPRARRRRRRALEDPRLDRPLDARPVRGRRGGRRPGARRARWLPRLRARRRRRWRRAPVVAGQWLAAVRRPRVVREDERPGGVQVRDPRPGVVRREAARGSAASRSTTSTCTCRTRRTSASSTMLSRKLGVRGERSWLMWIDTETPPPGRSLSRWPMRPRTGVSSRGSSC